jgi:hypothetical protein
MMKIAEKVKDKKVWSLIREYLYSGVMVDGLVKLTSSVRNRVIDSLEQIVVKIFISMEYVSGITNRVVVQKLNP